MDEPVLICIAFACTALGVAALAFSAGSGLTLGNRRPVQAGDAKNILYWLQPFLAGAVELSDRVAPMRSASEKLVARLRMRLIRAGQPGGLTPKEFVMFKVLAGSFLFLILTLQFGLSHFPICSAIALLGFYLPTLWLNERIKKQNLQIMGELPDALDLLSLMIGAGLDLGQAIFHYSRGSRPSPLKRLLDEVRAQMILGRTRSEALEYMARKVDIPAVSQAVSAFVQGDRLGASISDTLAMQATDLREQRLQRAETHGQTASIKLLAPLILFIMPCVGLVLFGPMLIQFMTGQ